MVMSWDRGHQSFSTSANEMNGLGLCEPTLLPIQILEIADRFQRLPVLCAKCLLKTQ